MLSTEAISKSLSSVTNILNVAGSSFGSTGTPPNWFISNVFCTVPSVALIVPVAIPAIELNVVSPKSKELPVDDILILFASDVIVTSVLLVMFI